MPKAPKEEEDGIDEIKPFVISSNFPCIKCGKYDMYVCMYVLLL